ncbi:nucleotidyltransferase [Clostridium perfringens]|uniref:nucleotidyltransferase domain-containing protein n=1 Tax=Clostridium perfringens TaxID=1502 RepID=UPI0011590C8F|nr:nucleotidyltransferase [Clostridium perfringens]ELP5177933.1 nucleotidyltransferase [Clostridium perfringens]ELP5181520.1 nucleotidyltransferase [Clostridium perfringens]ELP5183473.1 nucleotidyltransferase [Clostridium perfringens]ELP5188870.1 nucleotidyltransferase [Clostridium perfringens]MDM0666422.1 nucleotidyltransferase [Clostridium perfringens]
MTQNINTAFNNFMKDSVNLSSDRTSKARSSRDWLIEQINSIESKKEDFPKLYKDKNIFFGSFARNTKIRELDDIDLMICLKGNGTTYNENSFYTDNIELKVPDSYGTLRNLCHDNSNRLNSTKVINRFKKYIDTVPQYSNAEIHKNMEALTLKLSSYEWNFDIVPCFFTTEDSQGKTYYIIPDGKGYWKKTDPRIDRDNITTLNQSLGGNLLNVIRLIKYWNREKSIGINSSYLLETMIINFYSKSDSSCGTYLDIEFVSVLSYLKSAILNDVQDLKGIQGNINYYDFLERLSLSSSIEKYYDLSVKAREYESSDMKKCFKKWKEILGGNFPDYE